MNNVDFYRTDIVGENGEEILIHNGPIYRAVVIVRYLDYFETYEINKFVKITGMRKKYKYNEDNVIVVESNNSTKLIEKELRIINFNYKIIDNDYHALEKLVKGQEIMEKTYYDEPYYKQ